MNIRRLSKQYENLQAQIERGKQAGYYWQGSKLIAKFVPWQPHELAIRQAKADGLMNLITQVKLLYPSEELREPAIATVNENNEFRYLPLSKTGLSTRDIFNIRRSDK